jgi:hypothetical protein
MAGKLARAVPASGPCELNSPQASRDRIGVWEGRRGVVAYFTIRLRRLPGLEKADLEATVKYLGLTKITEDLYQLPNRNCLRLHLDLDGYVLEPT